LKKKKKFYATDTRLLTFKLPYLAARWSGVKPFFVIAVREALWSTRTDAT
jgi:hypothetical protein